MGIIQRKEIGEPLVDVEVSPRVTIESIENKNLPADVPTKEETDVSGKELLLAALLLLAVIGVVVGIILKLGQ